VSPFAQAAATASKPGYERLSLLLKKVAASCGHADCESTPAKQSDNVSSLTMSGQSVSMLFSLGW
jgi:hypothetical protein